MKILFAHSDRDFLVSFRDLLASHGFEVATAFDGPRAVSLAGETRFDAAVIDSKLPRLSLGEVLAVMRDADIPTVVTTDVRSSRAAAPDGLWYELLELPFGEKKLAEAIRRAVDRHAAERTVNSDE